jgi:protein involved in polysaccharide export with SLBB domain
MTTALLHLRACLLAVLLAAGAGLAAAQIDPLTVSPRGLTQLDAAPAAASAPASAGALPADPATAGKPLVFGSQIFSGRFGGVTYGGFNPDYVVASGDRIVIRMWGAFLYEATQVVDVQGNLFIPNVGPVAVRGVRNSELNRQVEAQIKRTFRSNVSVYATLEAAQPVKIYVTGFVKAPGLYGGLSSDSVLYYLDRAGGIDPDRGSYLEVDVLRGGKSRARINLYQFLLDGRMDPLQLQDGDTVVVAARTHTVQVDGEVLNPYVFEFKQAAVTGAELLAIARPKPGATHLSIVRSLGASRRSEYHAIVDAAKVMIEDGDIVSVTSDKYPGTILVRITGAHLGERTLVLPYGAQLKDALARVRPAPQARLEAVQLFRSSVAVRQKELLESSLRSLETYALTARSATSEEAALRGREAQQILTFIERARRIQPRGQVILGSGEQSGAMLLEDGDTLQVPERSNLVMVSGEVLMPNALVWEPGTHPLDFVVRAGGFTQGADQAKILVLRQDGSVVESAGAAVQPGDQIMVLPRIETKNIEVTRGITQILYQIAVAAKVLFGL